MNNELEEKLEMVTISPTRSRGEGVTAQGDVDTFERARPCMNAGLFVQSYLYS